MSPHRFYYRHRQSELRHQITPVKPRDPVRLGLTGSSFMMLTALRGAPSAHLHNLHCYYTKPIIQMML